MIGIFLIILATVCAVYWYASGKKDRNDIIEAAYNDLENAKAARKTAEIIAETGDILRDINKTNKQTGNINEK